TTEQLIERIAGSPEFARLAEQRLFPSASAPAAAQQPRAIQPFAKVPTLATASALDSPGSGGGLPLGPSGSSGLPFTPPLDENQCGCSGGGGEAIQSATGYRTALLTNALSDGPVRYFDGTVKLPTTDLPSSGFDMPSGQNRYWTNGRGYALNSFNGSGMIDVQFPNLQQTSGLYGPTIFVVTNGVNSPTFTAMP